jgi:hypothetical protein
MRKQIINPGTEDTAAADGGWLDLEAIARVEITSEEAAYPIESAFQPGSGGGWRASQPGAHTIRLRFDQPQLLSHIRLEFDERHTARTQEFVLLWSPDHGQSYREIVRQQWNFGPPQTTREVEDYHVDLTGVTVLELRIVPDISGGEARASLARLRLA